MDALTGKLACSTIEKLQEEVIDQRDRGTVPFSILTFVFDSKFERTRKACLRLAALILRAYEEGNSVLHRGPPGDRGELLPKDMRP